MHRFSETLNDHSADEFVQQVRSIGKRQPALLLGGAAIVGFALTRFFRTASTDDHEGYHDTYGDNSGYSRMHPAEDRHTEPPGTRATSPEPDEPISSAQSSTTGVSSKRESSKEKPSGPSVSPGVTTSPVSEPASAAAGSAGGPSPAGTATSTPPGGISTSHKVSETTAPPPASSSVEKPKKGSAPGHL